MYQTSLLNQYEEHKPNISGSYGNSGVGAPILQGGMPFDDMSSRGSGGSDRGDYSGYHRSYPSGEPEYGYPPPAHFFDGSLGGRGPNDFGGLQYPEQDSPYM